MAILADDPILSDELIQELIDGMEDAEAKEVARALVSGRTDNEQIRRLVETLKEWALQNRERKLGLPRFRRQFAYAA